MKPSQSVCLRNSVQPESNPHRTSSGQHSLDPVETHQVVVPYGSNLLQDLKEVDGCIVRAVVGQKAL